MILVPFDTQELIYKSKGGRAEGEIERRKERIWSAVVESRQGFWLVVQKADRCL